MALGAGNAVSRNGQDVDESNSEKQAGVVMGDYTCSRGRGFESQCHILDVLDIFSNLFGVKIEKTENKRK